MYSEISTNFNSQVFVQIWYQRLHTHSNLMQVKYLRFDSIYFNSQFIFYSAFQIELLFQTYWKISNCFFILVAFTIHCLEHISKRNYNFKCIEKYLSQFWFNKFLFTGLCSNLISKTTYSFKLNAGEISKIWFNIFQFTIHYL